MCETVALHNCGSYTSIIFLMNNRTVSVFRVFAIAANGNKLFFIVFRSSPHKYSSSIISIQTHVLRNIISLVKIFSYFTYLTSYLLLFLVISALNSIKRNSLWFLLTSCLVLCFLSVLSDGRCLMVTRQKEAHYERHYWKVKFALI